MEQVSCTVVIWICQNTTYTVLLLFIQWWSFSTEACC